MTRRICVLLFALFFGAIFVFSRSVAPGVPQVSYHMPRDGQLTLGLYTKDGRLVRWLVQDDFRHAGACLDLWDGLDQWGKPVSPGDYVIKGVYHDPLAAEYQMALCNPGNPPWPTGDGKGDWLCDEADPQAAVTDGKWVFLGSPGCEKGFSIIAVDSTGQRRWGTNQPQHFHPRCISLALNGKYLYALYSGPEAPDPDHYPNKGVIGRAALLCFDKETGELAGFSRGGLPRRIATWPYKGESCWLWDLRNGKSYTPARYGGQPRYACMDLGESTNALGIAASGNKIYVSLLYDNKVIAIDAATGQPTGGQIPVEAPVGLCAAGEGRLLAVSGKQVVSIELASGKVTPLISSGLEAPDSVATDKAGNIYVSDWGSSFQVKVFDPEGRFLHAVGKAGGRPWVGKWDANGMLVPRGIAVTDEGKLWVAEDDGTPPRISVWDAASGAFLRDYIGPAPYGGGTYFWIDPNDSTTVNAEGTRFKADYAGKTGTPEAITYRRKDRDDPFTPNGHDLMDSQVRILYRGGHEYAFVNMGRNVVSILQRQGDVYRAVAALGGVANNGSAGFKGDGTGKIVWDSDVGYHLYDGFFPDCFKGHSGDSYTWSDLDGDNEVEAGEMRWTKTATGPYKAGMRGRLECYWGTDISADWKILFAERFGDRLAIDSIAPRGWTAAGAPVYDMADARQVICESPVQDINGLHVTADNKIIVCYNYESSRCTDAIRCYDFNGKKLWAIAMPERKAGARVHATNAIYDFDIPGLGDVVCTWLYHGSLRPYFITSDGLYVGTLLDDTLLARSLHYFGFPLGYYVCTPLDRAPTGPAALWSESAKYFYQSRDGECYIINGANQQEYIFRIKGLEPGRVGRFQEDYHLGAAGSDAGDQASFTSSPLAAER